MQVYGYARLSREDLRGVEATEEKLQSRVQMCLALAAQHGLSLPPDHIISEIGTGTSLTARPGLLRLLDLANAGQVTHIVTPYQDRLTRGGDGDRGLIKEALCSGNVILVTTEGVMAFDRDFGDRHELLFDIKAAVASHYVRDVVKKRKEADLIRLKQGKPSRAVAPYGYHCVSKPDVLAGAYPAEQHGTFHVIAEEYVILEEIFRRLPTEKAAAICRDLNARGVPPPSANRPGIKGSRWFANSMYNIIRNPFYIGLLSQKSRIERGHGKVRLKTEEYVLSEVKGNWPCPITEEQHYAFQSKIEGHKDRRASRTGLLTGIVHCSNGRSMRIVAKNMYGCDCKERGEQHPGVLVGGDRLTLWVQTAINELVEALPDDTLTTPKRAAQDRGQAQAALYRAKQELTEKEQQTQDMILRETYFVSLMGRQIYEETAKKTRSILETLRERVQVLELAAATPDTAEVLTLLQRIRRLGGMARFWESATHEEQRGIIERIVRRIDVIPPQKRFITDATLELWEWAQEYAPPPPPFPKIPGGPNNLKRGN